MEREAIIEQAKLALRPRRWTLHLKHRRAREYTYAAQRTGPRTQDKYLTLLDDLPALMARIETLPNGNAANVGQPSAKRDQKHASQSSDPERLRLQVAWLERGRLMTYRRVILPPCLVDPGVDAWIRYAMGTEMPTLRRAVHAIRLYYGHLKDAGLVEEPQELKVPTGPTCSTVYDG